MKEYQKPEIELLDFTAEPITSDLPTLGLDPSFGVEDGVSTDEDL